MRLDPTTFYVTGGALASDAASYVERQADGALVDALRAGELCYILTARQMGKSSLMVRAVGRLRAEGIDAAVVDLTAIGVTVTPEQWYKGLLTELGQALDVEDDVQRRWAAQPDLAPMQRWLNALRGLVATRSGRLLVVFIDEIDAVRSLPFPTDDFFAGIRGIYNRRAREPALRGLTFCLLGVASPSDLIADPTLTPFNVGRRIELADFTAAEAARLSAGLNRAPAVAGALLDRVLYWTGAHPYLSQRLCQAVALDRGASRPRDVDRWCDALFLSKSARERDDNLVFVREHLLTSDGTRTALLDRYAAVLRRDGIDDDLVSPVTAALKLSGIVGARDGRLRVRNRIYAHVFDRRWVADHLPEAEIRRQRAAYRRGVIRAGTWAAVILAIVGALGSYALVQRNAARAAEDMAFARELAANARVQIDVDPELAILLALESLRARQSAQGEDALRLAVVASRVKAVLRGHTASVRFAAYSPDGTFIVTAGFDNTARLWDLETGRQRAMLPHQEWLEYAAVSPDSRIVATVSYDKTAALWDARTGRRVVGLNGHTGIVRSAVFSPDGTLVVTTSDDGTARVWDVPSGQLRASLVGHRKGVWRAAFNVNGSHLVTASWDGTFRVWNPRTWQSLRTVQAHTREIWGLALSPDASLVATSGGDHAARVWAVATGAPRGTLAGHAGWVTSVAFNPDGRLLVTASRDGSARIWDVRTGTLQHELRAHTSAVETALFSPDGESVLTASWDGTGRIWEVSTGQIRDVLRGHTSGLMVSAFSPDGRHVVTPGNDRTVRIWDVQRDGTPRELRGHTAGVQGAAFSPDASLVLTASLDKTARLWDVRTGRTIRSLIGHSNGVAEATFSPDGRSAATTSYDGTARLWDVRTGQALHELRGHSDRVYRGRFSPDGRLLATPSEDGTVTLWDVASGRSVRTLKGHSHGVAFASFSLDGSRLVSGGSDRNIVVWNVQTGARLAGVREPFHVEFGLFGPDGRSLITTSQAALRIRDSTNWAPIRDLVGHTFETVNASHSHDGRFLVSASLDGTARVWELSTGRTVIVLRGHTNAVSSAAFSPDDRRVLTSSSDGTARIHACDVCRPLDEVIALGRTRATRTFTPEERQRYLHESPSAVGPAPDLTAR